MNELFRILLNLPPQASSVAFEIDVLHYVVISISVLGAVGVALAVGIFLIRFRRKPGGPVTRRVGRVPVWAEVVSIGGLLAMFLAFWIVGFRQFVHLQTPPTNAMTIYVVAKQWMWQFAYPDGSATQGDLYVPLGRPVKLVMTSRDVIHSFFVPDFRIKQDVLPRRSAVTWFEATREGAHDILCTEYCGTEHSRMRGRVIALQPDDWARWAGAATRPAGSDLATLGAKVAAEHGCLRCHTVDGTPHLGPTWAGLYGSTIETAFDGPVRADEAYLTESMMDPTRKLRAGYTAIMPTYQGQIEGVKVAALVEYIRSLADREPVPDPLPTGPMPPTPIAPPSTPAPRAVRTP